MAVGLMVIVPFTELWKANHWSNALFWAAFVATMTLVLVVRLAFLRGTDRRPNHASGAPPRVAK